MGKLTVLLELVVTLLVVLQFGAETRAAANMQYSYPQTYMPQYNMQNYAMPQYVPQQYYPQQYETKQTAPSYSYPSPQQSGEFEGLNTENAVVGDKNTQFTGFDVLSDLNLPVNFGSITDILG